MNSYEQKTTDDLKRIFEAYGAYVSADCFDHMLGYFASETRRSFLAGMRRQKHPSGQFKTALQAGRLQAVEQSG
jgi:hypothetical protein